MSDLDLVLEAAQRTVQLAIQQGSYYERLGMDSIRDETVTYYQPVQAAIERIRATEIIHVARCQEHGLHGCRIRCYECGEEAEQVPMLEVH